MSPAKRFLIAYAVVYLAIAIAINAVWGPPGLSKEFSEAHRDEYDQYLSITKSDAYKLWLERPELNEPGEDLAAQIEFLEEFEARPELRAEQQRRGIYENIFDVFNSLTVVVLGYRFAKKPLLAFVDGQIAQLRERIEGAESDSRSMAGRKALAASKLDGIDGERGNMADEVARRLELERAQVHENTAQGIALLERETRDRKRNAELRARQKLKETLVDEAIGAVASRYESRRNENSESQLIDSFLDELGRR